MKEPKSKPPKRKMFEPNKKAKFYWEDPSEAENLNVSSCMNPERLKRVCIPPSSKAASTKH